MSTNGNDMAFPVLDRSQTPNETYQLGFSKREQFAAMALQGLLTTDEYTPNHAVELAVEAADLLIAALNKADSAR